MNIKYLIVSMRPKQWLKNLFVIAPLLFSKNLMDGSLAIQAFTALILFCLLSSGVYLINDVIDLNNDRDHPKKALRPLANGKISSTTLILWAMLILACVIIISYMFNPRFCIIGLCYLAINLLYMFHLKHYPVIDVICISCGFVLRVIAGGIVVGVPSSQWILTTTIFISLFLGFAKRRSELALSGASAAKSSRAVLEKYNMPILDQFLVICATSAILSYALFAVSDYALIRFGTHNLIFTIPFVIYGVFRYLYLTQFSDSCESPSEVLFVDRSLAITILLWVVLATYIIYK